VLEKNENNEQKSTKMHAGAQNALYKARKK